MTQRERYLAMSVGVVATLLLGNIAFKRVVGSITQRENKVAKAEDDLRTLDSTIDAGKRAAVKIERLDSRSLPSDGELAKAQYGNWLLELARQVGMTQETVRHERSQSVKVPMMIGNQRTQIDAYNFHEFTLTGKCRSDKIIDMLAAYYDRDYLHRISKFSIIRDPKQINMVDVIMTSQAVSLPKSKASTEPNTGSSGRLELAVDEYKKKILERNPFAPPNNAPKFETSRSHDVTIGKPWSLKLEAADPDGDRVSYELVTEADKLPSGLSLQSGEISWQPKEKMESEIVVRAIDEGWPKKSVELKLALKAVEPAVEKKETPPATLDPAKQAYLTGLVSGPTGAQGWIRSKAEGLSIDIAEGTEINVGSIKAVVVKINPIQDHIILEADGNRCIMDMNTSLAEAWAKSLID